MQDRKETERWLDTATRGIRFGPDRRAVRAELEEHIEDRTEQLSSWLDPGSEALEAEALRGMGDAEELGRKLARLHRPWLGWLWYASRALVGILLLVCLLGVGSGIQKWQPGHVPGPSEAPAEREPESAKLGGYTFRIVEAMERNGTFRVVLRVSGLRFWEPADETGLVAHLRVELEDGTCIALENPAYSVEINRLYTSFPDTAARVAWGSDRGPDSIGEASMEIRAQERLFCRDIAIQLGESVLPGTGERIALVLDLPLGQIRLSARCGEEDAA